MDKKQQEVNVNINLDTTPVLYTDSIFMTTNEDGVVLDVGQKVGASPQVRIVARIGMSREHAKKFVHKVNELLAMTAGHSETTKRN